MKSKRNAKTKKAVKPGNYGKTGKTPLPHGIVAADDANFPAGAVKIVNHGGPVIGSVQVVPIYWGTAWANPANASLAAQLDAFFAFLVTSPLMDVLAQYGIAATPIRHGACLPSVHIATDPPSAVTDSAVQQTLQAWIAAGTVPPPTVNTLHFLYLPPGVASVNANGQTSCSQFCGYHGALPTGGAYAVVPFLDCGFCRLASGLLDTFTAVSSHEFCEVVTDPTLRTWFDTISGNEIADACNRQTARLGGFLVEAVWSNGQSACVIAPSIAST